LALTDRTSMASSVEVRVPFLDHRLVELVFNTNPEWNLNIHGSENKQSLKQAMKSHLPSEILRLPKTGFNAPVRDWVGQGTQEMQSRVLHPRSPILQEILNSKNISQIWDNVTSRCSASESLFMIYVADLWLEHHAS